MNKRIHILLFFMFISLMLASSVNYAQNVIQRPAINEGPIKVKVLAAILNINEINAAKQLITANVFFVAQWKDSRLIHQGPANITCPMKEIWNPKLMIVNRQSMEITMPDEAEIQPDGTVIYRQRVYGDFSQMLDYSDFPFDKQKFKIRIVSSGYTPDDVEFAADSLQKSVISNELTIMDWNILEINNINSPFTFEPGTRPVASISFEITAERKSTYYELNFLLPLVLIILMSMSVFWLDPKLANPQISISSTSMLTLIAYRFMIAGSLPKIAYLTRMDTFIFYSTVLIFMTLSEAVLTVTLAARNNEVLAKKIDLYSRYIFPFLYIIISLIAFL